MVALLQLPRVQYSCPTRRKPGPFFRRAHVQDATQPSNHKCIITYSFWETAQFHRFLQHIHSFDIWVQNRLIHTFLRTNVESMLVTLLSCKRLVPTQIKVKQFSVTEYELPSCDGLHGANYQLVTGWQSCNPKLFVVPSEAAKVRKHPSICSNAGIWEWISAAPYFHQVELVPHCKWNFKYLEKIAM